MARACKVGTALANLSMPIPGFFEATEMPDAGWWETLWSDPSAVLSAVGLKPRTSVIDLCCGDGWFTLQIAKTADCVAAIDIDPKLIEVTRRRLAQEGIANCDLIVGNAYNVADLTRERADFIFLANAFHGVPDRPRLGRAVHDALRPSGRFAVVNGIRVRARILPCLENRGDLGPNCACQPSRRLSRWRRAV